MLKRKEGVLVFLIVMLFVLGSITVYAGRGRGSTDTPTAAPPTEKKTKIENWKVDVTDYFKRKHSFTIKCDKTIKECDHFSFKFVNKINPAVPTSCLVHAKVTISNINSKKDISFLCNIENVSSTNLENKETCENSLAHITKLCKSRSRNMFTIKIRDLNAKLRMIAPFKYVLTKLPDDAPKGKTNSESESRKAGLFANVKDMLSGDRKKAKDEIEEADGKAKRGGDEEEKKKAAEEAKKEQEQQAGTGGGAGEGGGEAGTEGEKKEEKKEEKPTEEKAKEETIAKKAVRRMRRLATRYGVAPAPKKGSYAPGRYEEVGDVRITSTVSAPAGEVPESTKSYSGVSADDGQAFPPVSTNLDGKCEEGDKDCKKDPETGQSSLDFSGTSASVSDGEGNPVYNTEGDPITATIEDIDGDGEEEVTLSDPLEGQSAQVDLINDEGETFQTINFEPSADAQEFYDLQNEYAARKPITESAPKAVGVGSALGLSGWALFKLLGMLRGMNKAAA